jgi:hydroxyacylglutathione hydrolase
MEVIDVNACNPGPMTGTGNHTYLLVGTGGATLIDAGVGEPSHLTAIDRLLSDRRSTLARVLVTHAHSDHTAGAPALSARYPGVSFWKYPWPDQDGRYSVRWHPLADGDRIDVGGDYLQVFYTPGHSPDHVAFWQASSRTAFTGDLVVKGSSVMIQASRGGSLRDYLASLERIRQMNAARLCPAHGPIIDDPAQVLLAYMEHRRMRERQVIDALTAGLDAVTAIADSIYDGLEPALMSAARENVRAHLDKLAAEGRASESGGRWTTRQASPEE